MLWSMTGHCGVHGNVVEDVLVLWSMRCCRSDEWELWSICWCCGACVVVDDVLVLSSIYCLCEV